MKVSLLWYCKDCVNVLFLVTPAFSPRLITWDILIRFLAEFDALTRISFCESLDFKLASDILGHLFSSLPNSPGTGALFYVRRKYFLNNHLSEVSRLLMKAEDLFSIKFSPQNALLLHTEHFICNLYFRSLITVPVIIRDWYTSLGKQMAVAVNKSIHYLLREVCAFPVIFRYTKTYVSKLAVRNEISSISNMKRGKLEVC